ncbi:MAG: biopolymer transporter ExbD [Kiritimatiellae bacterium]|nr:biopolymer transporter ExbD [Kiritimatiellia bacterium]
MARKTYDNPKAEMTPMIDVVFQLMIFFVVTIKQEDIFSKLNANRPAPNAGSAQSEENDTQIKIDIGPEGVVFNTRGVSFKELDSHMKQLSKASTQSMVLVRCTLNSPHGFLVQVLDICNKYKMYNVSIFSM